MLLQDVTSGGNTVVFALLTGGLLVRVQPEETISLTESGTSDGDSLTDGYSCPFLALSAVGAVSDGSSSRLISAWEKRRRQMGVAHRHLDRRVAKESATLRRDAPRIISHEANVCRRCDDIAPIPGTKRVARVEENTAADGIELSAHQVERLNHLTPAAGKRHDEGNMAVIDRWGTTEVR